ncbi:MAG TPA: BTAD domain-containing putative transcriptional regulator [Patescibacteria group bacterium]|nr:BTAD domain-containing putative transcriptional regulator [Patescibacteria group bacterium]
MEFRVLGPLEAVDDGRSLVLGGPRQRALLAYLVLEANRVVSTDRLIDRIWGDEPPEAARQALFAYISRLRKLLGAGRIQARPPGYILRAERDEVDALRFADLIAEAHRLSDDRDAAATRLSEALELWRGTPLSDLAHYEALRPAIAGLEEMHAAALEDRIQAQIDRGRHREALPVLEALIGEHPLRERLWSQLIVALYRSGRQADALGAFHRARRILAEELGIDPSRELRRLHEQVLQQDAALDSFPDPASPVHEPAVADGAPRSDARHRHRPVLIGAVLVAALGSATALWMIAPHGLPRGEWTIGLDMPLSGPRSEQGQAVLNAVQMAVDDVNAAGGFGGSRLALDIRDDADDAAQAAANGSAFVADPRALAMIGPWGSGPSFATIPVTNQAGLLECSPASTHPGLTKPRAGALDVRSSRPGVINFLRIPPADDIQAVAMAVFAYRQLGGRSVLVIDDADVGRVIADPFQSEFTKLGGRTLRLALNHGTDPGTVLASLGDPDPPDLVVFGGNPEMGAAIRAAMVNSGNASTALLSWDFLFDGSGADPGSYIQRLGDAAVGSYVAHASLPDPRFSFTDAYQRRFDAGPDEYAAAGYACVQVIAAALRDVAATGPSAQELRELVRASSVDTTHRYETVLGTIGFDANGDNLQQYVTFYRVEASAADGAGDWVISEKQDFGPAP